MTPWGEPSDSLIIGEFDGGIKVAFLPRHGRGHYLTPTEVPSKANIAALKHVGCKVILVRSLRTCDLRVYGGYTLKRSVQISYRSSSHQYLFISIGIFCCWIFA